MRVLIIEDEMQIARHITRALFRTGHEASAVHDGAEGLRMALAHPPEIIVLDLNLPGLDGIEVLARQKKEQCPSRVLILTARGDVPDGRGGGTPWARDMWRIDAALAYRFTAHTQLKVHFILENEDGPRQRSHALAVQFTLRF